MLTSFRVHALVERTAQGRRDRGLDLRLIQTRKRSGGAGCALARFRPACSKPVQNAAANLAKAALNIVGLHSLCGPPAAAPTTISTFGRQSKTSQPRRDRLLVASTAALRPRGGPARRLCGARASGHYSAAIARGVVNDGRAINRGNPSG